MKKVISILISVFLLSLMAVGVFASEMGTRPSTTPVMDSFDPTGLMEASEQAQLEEKYAKAYYFLTDKILSSEAVIEYMTVNYPSVDISSIEEYKNELNEIRNELSTETDFVILKNEIKELVEMQKDFLHDILLDNAVAISDIKNAIEDFKEASTEDDDTKEAWGEARANAIYAKAAVMLGALESFSAGAESILGDDATDELNALIEEIDAKVDELAIAAENFEDKETIKGIANEVKNIVKEAKEESKDIREQMHKRDFSRPTPKPSSE